MPPTNVSLPMIRNAFTPVSFLFAKVRNATVSACIPAFPSHERDNRHEHRERQDFLNRRVEKPDHD